MCDSTAWCIEWSQIHANPIHYFAGVGWCLFTGSTSLLGQTCLVVAMTWCRHPWRSAHHGIRVVIVKDHSFWHLWLFASFNWPVLFRKFLGLQINMDEYGRCFFLASSIGPRAFVPGFGTSNAWHPTKQWCWTLSPSHVAWWSFSGAKGSRM